MSYVYLTEENVKLQKKAGRYLVGRNLEVVMEIPEETMEGLVLVGRIQVSAEAMVSLLQQGIPVTWISHTGKYYGRLTSTSHVDVFRQQKQIQLQQSPIFLELAKKSIEAKVHNQLTVLRRYNRRANIRAIESAINNILAVRRHIMTAEDSAQLMGFEGVIAKSYFGALSKLMPEGFEFAKRTKRPPLDPCNSMLSFGYTLLMYEFYTAVENMGLNPYFGYLHALKNHHPALASDLMEEWRALVVDSIDRAGDSMDDYDDYEEEEFVAKSDRRYIVLVIYDIVDNKSRLKMVKCLESYGIRMQKSAFEAYLTKKKYEQLMKSASKIIDKETDSLRGYLLANNTSVRSWGTGDKHIEDVIVF